MNIIKKIIRELLRTGRLALALCLLALALLLTTSAQAQVSTPFAIPGVTGIWAFTNTGPTNIAVPVPSIIPVHYAKAGSAYTSPLSSVLWAASQGAPGFQSTNTYWFANSRDGTTNTLASSNYWWSVSAIAQGTNPTTAFVPIGASNYIGAQGIALVQITLGSTNAMTNLQSYISWPE